jgi:hypothetical protein
MQGTLQGLGLSEEASSAACFNKKERNNQLQYYVSWAAVVAGNETLNASLTSREYFSGLGNKLDDSISFRSRYCAFKSADSEAVADKVGINPQSVKFVAALNQFMELEPISYRYIMTRMWAAFSRNDFKNAGRVYAGLLEMVADRAAELKWRDLRDDLFE